MYIETLFLQAGPQWMSLVNCWWADHNGDTAILYRHGLARYINTLTSRISAVFLSSNTGPMLLVCVYMPADYGDSDCLECTSLHLITD